METVKELTARFPELRNCADAIERSASLLIEAFRTGGTLFTCGNGGSSADADHIVGELAKGFRKKRPLSEEMRKKLDGYDPSGLLSSSLQDALPAVSLHSQSALLTAYLNDCSAPAVYAQALLSLGRPGSVLLAISTSGNSENVVLAAKTAKALGMKVIALTGASPCALDPLSDAAVHVGASETYRIQELHLPVYHWLCARVEEEFFPV